MTRVQKSFRKNMVHLISLAPVLVLAFSNIPIESSKFHYKASDQLVSASIFVSSRPQIHFQVNSVLPASVKPANWLEIRRLMKHNQMKALKHVNSKCGIEYRYLQCEIFKAFLNIFFSFSTTFKKETFMLLCKSHALFSTYNPLFILESFTQSDIQLARMLYCMFRNYSITKLTLSTLFPTKILIHS